MLTRSQNDLNLVGQRTRVNLKETQPEEEAMSKEQLLQDLAEAYEQFMKGPPDTPTIHLGVRRPHKGGIEKLEHMLY